MEERPDEISISAAATLLGITPRRIRQLAQDGFVVVHRRGYTSVSSAVGGYIRALKAEAGTSAASAAAARAHGAKAALIRSHTARRRAALIAREEAEGAVKAVADAAVRRLKDARFPTGLPPEAGKTFAAEIAAACARITAARDRALAALASGDASLLDGGRDG